MEDGPDATPLAGDDPFAALPGWVAAQRVVDAARERVRRRWLRQIALEEATFTGTLVDLAEQRHPVILASTAGSLHRGVIRGVAPDFCALAVAGGRDVLVALDAVVWVRPVARRAAPTGSTGARPLTLELTLADALGRLAAGRPRVLVAGPGRGERLRGELRDVGTDVASLRLDGEPAWAHVRIAAIAELTVEAP